MGLFSEDERQAMRRNGKAKRVKKLAAAEDMFFTSDTPGRAALPVERIFYQDIFGTYCPLSELPRKEWPLSASLYCHDGDSYHQLPEDYRPADKTPTASSVATVGTESLPVSNTADEFSDMRIAFTFAVMNAGRLRFSPEFGKWLLYDGKRWTTDNPGGAFPNIKAMIKELYAKVIDGVSDYAQREAMMKAIIKLEAHPRQETILSAASHIPELIVTSCQLDRDPMLLNCLNGTIELKTGTLRRHSADNFITKIVNIEYDRDATCPIFLRFLDRIMGGKVELIAYLQRFAGYCLTGLTTEQILLFLYGLGANGKSVLANIFDALLGDFAATAGSDLLMARDKRTATNDIAALRGARLVKVSEFDDGEKLAEAQIKTLTGGDPVTCRHLYQEYFTFIPAFKILLIGNHRPKVRGTDYGIWRRIHFLHFRETIPEEERDPHLQSKLIAELPGILNWAVQGCIDWQRTGLNPPDEMKSDTAEYRKSEDIFDLWLDDCCNQGEHLTAPANSLLNSFIEYSKWKATTPQKLGRMLSDTGFTREKTGGVIWWRGLALQSTDNNWQDKDTIPF